MDEIIVKSQKELDEIPVDYHGRIIIKFGTPYNRAVVNRRYKFPVVAWGNSSVVAWGNSSVVACGNSSVVAWGNSSVVACGNSSVVAWGNSSVEARENSSVVACGNSSVEARENSSVVARGNSSVVARGNSSVVAWGNSSVVARGNSSVDGNGNAQVVDSTYSHNVNVSGNARIVYNPKTAQDYVDFYGLESNGTTVKLYKAVHKRNGVFESDNNRAFKYVVGEEAVADRLDTNTDENCGHGIHAAHMAWCIDYGRCWEDLAILEVEMALDGLVVPVNGSGKVRAAKCKVLREVPLSECGLYGKILERQRVNG